MQAPILELKNIGKIYVSENNVAVGIRGVNLAFARGEFVAVTGKAGSGKSTLTNHLVGEKITIVSNKPQTTRNRICGIVTRDDTQFVFVDTPGYHRSRTKLGDYMVNVARESIADVDATILVVEPVANIGGQEADLIAKIKASRSPAILAINKQRVEHRIVIIPTPALTKAQRIFHALICYGIAVNSFNALILQVRNELLHINR